MEIKCFVGWQIEELQQGVQLFIQMVWQNSFDKSEFLLKVVLIISDLSIPDD